MSQTPPFSDRPLHALWMLSWVILLACFFAQVEIQIEGAVGWAGNLPTWRIDHHWLLDIFWGGRTMTGYHAWLFPFIALVFHWPFFFAGTWRWRIECRVIGCIMLFWLCEDFLWFILNPAYGLAHFNPVNVIWHKHWWGPLPADYWIFTPSMFLLLWFSYQPQLFRPYLIRRSGATTALK